MSETSVNGCCGDTNTADYNPKRDRGGRNRGQFVILNTLANPIPKEIEDSQELKRFFEKWPFVPYAGSNILSGHSVLVFYEMLRKLSPTHGACMNKKATYAFGTAATTIKATNPEFDTGEEKTLPATADRKRYEQALFGQLTFDRPLREMCRHLSIEYESNGNGWVELTIGREAGQTRGRICTHPQTHVMYANTAPDEAEFVALSPVWTDEYLTRNPPRLVMKYPNWTEDENGALHTVFHLKNGTNVWYGRPGSESADINKFSEVQVTFYRVRSVYGEFTGKLIIETEDENPIQNAQINNEEARKAGFKDYVDRFEDNYTNKGNNPQGVIVVNRAFGAKPMFVFALPANQNHYYFKGVSDLDAEMILRAHETTKRFMSFDMPSGLSHDAFIEDYIVHMEPVINNLRRTVMVFFNQVLSAFWEMSGQVELNQQSLWFGSPIDSTVENFKTLKNTPPQLPQTTNGNNADNGQ